MSNNISVKDGNGNLVTLRTTDDGAGFQIGNVRVADATAANFLPTMDAAARKGFFQITDGTNVIPAVQFHNADNTALGSGYQVPTGGVGQVLNVNGNLDRAKGYQGDQLPGTGIPLDVSMTLSRFPPTFATNTITAGASKLINVPSTTNIKVGSVVQLELDTSAVVEWCRVNTVVTNTSFTVDNAANGHTFPYAVFPILANGPRDAQGEQDLPGGLGATLAVDYNFDGVAYQRARNAFGLGVYSDTSASNVSAGNNVQITTAGTPPTLAAGQTLPMLIIDSANSKQELAIAIATSPGSKTINFQTLANAYNGSVTALQIRAPIQTLINANPVNFNGWGLAADLAVLFSGQDTNGVPQFSVERDINGAGLAPVQGAASAAGMDADVDYSIFRTWANRFAVTTDKGLTPLVGDLAGNLQVAVQPNGTPVYNGSGNVAAASAVATLTIPSAKMGYLDGFDIDGLGATAGVSVAVTVAGLLGGTLTMSFGIPAGVTTPVTHGRFRFNPPLQASAVNTNIVVTVPSFGTGNTNASCTAYGHYI